MFNPGSLAVARLKIFALGFFLLGGVITLNVIF